MTSQTGSTCLSWEETGDRLALKIAGDWSLANYAALRGQVASFRKNDTAVSRLDDAQVDCRELGKFDTAGAVLLCELLGVSNVERLLQARDVLPQERKALLETVSRAVKEVEQAPEPKPSFPFSDLLERVGVATLRFRRDAIDLLGFIGMTLQALARGLVQPSRWRPTAVVAQIEETAFNAVPIIALLTFLVGAVIAFLGSTVLSSFGASIYTVSLVGFSFLREFAVLLTAILMAGRTASAFTAQLGSMKANEEIDALRAQGLDPMDMLVLPRVLAMLVAMPILTFVGMVAGIFGGALVCIFTLDISSTMFLTVFDQSISIRHFYVGMSKAPIFAFLIAVIGCLQGFQVSGSAQSVGQHTTTSVVHSIFVVILVDALAALFFMEMGW